MKEPLFDWLRRHRLLKEEAGRVEPSAAPPHRLLLELCERGALEGGLCVALDVRPDELVGPLCAAVGGSARSLKVLDVREGPPLELHIGYQGMEERWEVEDLLGLVRNLNDLLRADKEAKVVAILGEWQDALQLWALPRRARDELLRLCPAELSSLQ